MSLSLLEELSDGLVEIYDEIGVPMTYIPLDETVVPDKFGSLISSYDTTRAFLTNGLLNIPNDPDKDTSLSAGREDGKVAIVTKHFVERGITPKKKDKIEVVDTMGNTLNFVVVGINKTPGATNVAIPFLMTYLDVEYDGHIVRK